MSQMCVGSVDSGGAGHRGRRSCFRVTGQQKDGQEVRTGSRGQEPEDTGE